MSMPSPESDHGPLAEDLQFEEAEYTPGTATAPADAPTCVACKAPIADAYYEIGGQIVCAGCRERIGEAALGGSRVGRVLKAFLLGSVAAAVGAGAYYAIWQMTGWNIGLVAIAVGLMVGGAVKTGSGNRGGRFYQFLAVFLTYSSIVAMFAVPFVIQAFRDGDDPPAEAKPDPGKAAPAAAKAEKADPKAAKPAPDKPAPAEVKAEKGDPKAGRPDNDKPLSPGAFLLVFGAFLALLIGFCYSIPIQLAVASPISGLIFGFALWEAWKINRRVEIAFNGPFRLAAPGGGGSHGHDA